MEERFWLAVNVLERIKGLSKFSPWETEEMDLFTFERLGATYFKISRSKSNHYFYIYSQYILLTVVEDTRIILQLITGCRILVDREENKFKFKIGTRFPFGHDKSSRVIDYLVRNWDNANIKTYIDFIKNNYRECSSINLFYIKRSVDKFYFINPLRDCLFYNNIIFNISEVYFQTSEMLKMIFPKMTTYRKDGLDTGKIVFEKTSYLNSKVLSTIEEDKVTSDNPERFESDKEEPKKDLDSEIDNLIIENIKEKNQLLKEKLDSFFEQLENDTSILFKNPVYTSNGLFVTLLTRNEYTNNNISIKSDLLTYNLIVNKYVYDSFINDYIKEKSKELGTKRIVIFGNNIIYKVTKEDIDRCIKKN